MKKAYIIQYTEERELHKLAQRYWDTYHKKPKKYGFGVEQYNLDLEAEKVITREDFWSTIREYIKQDFNETLIGDWSLAFKDGLFFIEQDPDSVQGVKNGSNA